MFRDLGLDPEWDDQFGETFSNEEIRESDQQTVTYTEENPVALYLRDMARYPLLTSKEEVKLAEEIQHCQRSLISLFAEIPVYGDDIDRLRKKIVTVSRGMNPVTVNANLVEQVLRCLREIDEDDAAEDEVKTLFDEIHHLEKRLRRASDRMVRSNLRLVFSIAKKYFNTGLSLADLVQEGNMGLMRAVARFDPDRGVRFSTYATWWIRQAIRRGIEEKARTIRIPVHMLEALGRYRDLVNSVSDDAGELPPNLVMKRARLSKRQWDVLRNHTDEPVSLDTPKKDDAAKVMDLIADRDALAPCEAAFHKERSEKLKHGLSQLSLREEMIIEKRFGLNEEKPCTLDEISRQIGVSRERVRQIEQKALSKLRVVGEAEGFQELLAT